MGAAAEPFVQAFRYKFWEKNPVRVPPPADIVTMELREVFRPIDRQEQLFPAPSNDFKNHMALLGFDKYWSDSYWASHWELPSVSQAFEMYYRLRPTKKHISDITGLEVPAFTGDDLLKLLKKLDVFPKYHEQLSKIAYQPLTRIDVRRMRRLGVLKNASEVKERYLDLGYSPNDAQTVAEFIEKDIYESEFGVSKSELADMYFNGVVSKEEFLKYINRFGFDEEGKTLYIRWIEYKKLTKGVSAHDRAFTKADIIKALTLGNFSDVQAMAELRKIGYSTEEAQIFIKNSVGTKKITSN